MSVPTTESLLLPFLLYLGDGEVKTLKQTTSYLASSLEVSKKDLGELQPSGVQTKFEKRVGWAKYYLSKAGFIKTVSRGEFKITKLGLEKLSDKASKISMDEIEERIARKK